MDEVVISDIDPRPQEASGCSERPEITEASR